MVEENVTTPETQQKTAQQPDQQPDQQQPTQEKSKGLMPGQESEDELDAMGALMFAGIRNGFNWIKNLFGVKKVE